MTSREKTPSKEYIDFICDLYGNVYDDRLEDYKPLAAGDELRDSRGDWALGQVAEHKSISAFQKGWKVKGIELSISKIFI